MAELADILRETTEAMACFASVDMELWNRHSNACLQAAAALAVQTQQGVEECRQALERIANAGVRAWNVETATEALNTARAIAATALDALVDVPAVESEPEPIAWYMHLWNEADEDVKSDVRWGRPTVDDIARAEHNGHDIEYLYGAHPPRSLSDEGSEAERVLDELLQLLVAESGAAYCQSLRQFEQVPCLGWERKAKDGAYGEAEHAAHRKANELMGRHQGLARAVQILRTALSTRKGSASTSSGGSE